VGAANVLAAYRLYAGKVPNTSLVVLSYMAVVSLDKDGEPAWWEGHDMLAIRCFGYPEPVSKAAHRAVERAITPLFKEGAITVTRHSSGRLGRVTTVRYRLWLQHPAPDEKRRVHNLSTRRKSDEHPTKNGSAPDEKRRAKEEEEEEEREIDGSVVDPTVEGGGPDTRPRNGTEVARQAAANALTEWIRAHPEAAT
jgi:hypothetical protein